MAKIFFLLLTITIFAGSNADRDVIGTLDSLSQTCNFLQNSTSYLDSQIAARRNQLAERNELSRRVSNKECRDRIGKDTGRISAILDNYSNKASEFKSDISQTRQYVQNIKNKGNNYMTQHKQELIATSRQKSLELDKKFAVAKRLSIRLPGTSTEPSESAFIHTCLDAVYRSRGIF